MILKKKINIATILPYKENYSLEKASAASLWVSEFFKKSIVNLIIPYLERKGYKFKILDSAELERLYKQEQNKFNQIILSEDSESFCSIISFHIRKSQPQRMNIVNFIAMI